MYIIFHYILFILFSVILFSCCNKNKIKNIFLIKYLKINYVELFYPGQCSRRLRLSDQSELRI